MYFIAYIIVADWKHLLTTSSRQSQFIFHRLSCKDQGYNPAAEAASGARLILKSLGNGNSVLLPKIRTMIDSICLLSFLSALVHHFFPLPSPILFPQHHLLSWQLRKIGHPEIASLYPGKNLNILMGSYWTTRSNIMKRWGNNVTGLGYVGKGSYFLQNCILARKHLTLLVNDRALFTILVMGIPWLIESKEKI